MDLDSALRLLRRLAAAGPDVDAAAAAAPQLDGVLLWLHASGVPPSPPQLTALAAALAGALRSSLGALLADWPATARHLLQHSGSTLTTHQDAAYCVAHLCMALSECAEAQTSGARASPQQASNAALLARLLLAPSGLLPLLARATTAAAGSLEQCAAGGGSREPAAGGRVTGSRQQQQQQQQRAAWGAPALLNAGLLRLWCSAMAAAELGMASSEPMWALEPLRVTAVPAARLSLAQVRVRCGSAVAAAPPATVDEQALHPFAPGAAAAAFQACLQVAGSLAQLQQACNSSQQPSSSGSAEEAAAVVRQLSNHPAVLQATVLCQAVAALNLRLSAAAEAEAVAAGSRQRQSKVAAVPAHHTALLAALGLPRVEVLLAQRGMLRLSWEAAMCTASECLASLMRILKVLKSCGVASDSSGRSEPAGSAADSQLLAPLALTVMETVALATLELAGSGPHSAGSLGQVSSVIGAGLACLVTAQFLLGAAAAAAAATTAPAAAGAAVTASRPLQAASAASTAGPAPRSGQQQQLETQLLALLGPGSAGFGSEALLLLVPAVQRACNTARPQAPELAAQWEQNLSTALLALLLQDPHAPARYYAALGDALLQRPLSSVAALEAALRQGVGQLEPDSALSELSWRLINSVHSAGPVLPEQLGTWGQPDALAAAAAADAGGLGWRLFALLLSCAKALRLAVSKGAVASIKEQVALLNVVWVAMRQGGPQLLAATAAVLQTSEPADALAAAATSSSSSSWPHSVLRSPLVPWLVLAARCLDTLVWLSQQDRVQQLSEQLSEEQAHAASRDVACWCHKAVVWVGLGLQQLVPLCQQQQVQAPAAGAADQQAALQQLLAQQGQLQAALLQACNQLASGVSSPAANSSSQASGVSSALPLSAALAAQLQAFAAGVIQELPLPMCCNSPACSSLQQSSELLLVRGKGCVCAGCGLEAARYCSRDCQAQHWKQHRRACQRLQAAVAAAATMP